MGTLHGHQGSTDPSEREGEDRLLRRAQHLADPAPCATPAASMAAASPRRRSRWKARARPSGDRPDRRRRQGQGRLRDRRHGAQQMTSGAEQSSQRPITWPRPRRDGNGDEQCCRRADKCQPADDCRRSRRDVCNDQRNRIKYSQGKPDHDPGR